MEYTAKDIEYALDNFMEHFKGLIVSLNVKDETIKKLEEINKIQESELSKLKQNLLLLKPAYYLLMLETGRITKELYEKEVNNEI